MSPTTATALPLDPDSFAMTGLAVGVVILIALMVGFVIGIYDTFGDGL